MLMMLTEKQATNLMLFIDTMRPAMRRCAEEWMPLTESGDPGTRAEACQVIRSTRELLQSVSEVRVLIEQTRDLEKYLSRDKEAPRDE